MPVRYSLMSNWKIIQHIPEIKISRADFNFAEVQYATHALTVVRSPEYVNVIFGITYCRNSPEIAMVVIITCASLCSCGLKQHTRDAMC